MVMAGVVLLVGRVKAHKEVKEWKEVRAQVNEALVSECREFDASAKGRKKAWVECRKANKDLSADEVSKRGSKAVQIFQKWVEVCRLVRQIAQQLRQEAAAGADGGADDEDAEEE